VGRRAALACFLLLAWAAAVGAAAPPKAPEFRGMAFGSALSSLPDMHPVASYGDVTYARRNEEKPLLGDQCHTDIRYAFSRGALYFVRMTLTGCEGHGTLVRAYLTKYGRPQNASAPGTLRLVWNLPTLRVSLSHFAREGVTQVDYVYLPDLSRDDRDIWQSPADIRANGPLGFRGLRFGRDIAGIPGMELAYKEGAATYYRRRGDRMELGEIHLSDVLYGFAHGRFFAAVMEAPEAADFEPLRQAYLVKYGQPRAVPATLEEDLIWSWPKAQIALSRDAAGGVITTRYTDTAILAEVVRAEGAAGAPPVISGGLRLFSRGDPPRSFRGAAFGSPVTALPGAEYQFSHRGRKYYRRAGERLNLGDIPLTKVLYAYTNDRLASVALTVAARGADPEQDFERVLSAYTTKYGPATARATEEGDRLFLWTWPGLSIALCSPKVGPLEIHYVDTSLLRRREANLASQALGTLDHTVFETPKEHPSRIERANGEE